MLWNLETGQGINEYRTQLVFLTDRMLMGRRSNSAMSNEDKGIIQRFIAMSKCCSQHDRSARRRMFEEEGLRKAVPRWQQAAGRAQLQCYIRRTASLLSLDGSRARLAARLRKGQLQVRNCAVQLKINSLKTKLD